MATHRKVGVYAVSLLMMPLELRGPWSTCGSGNSELFRGGNVPLVPSAWVENGYYLLHILIALLRSLHCTISDKGGAHTLTCCCCRYWSNYTSHIDPAFTRSL